MRWLASIAFLTFVLDQASKYFVLIALDLGTRRTIEVFPPYLVLREGMNTGINFGLFSGEDDLTRWALVGVAVLLPLILVIWAWRSFTRRMEFISAGMVIGGALGNAADRVLHTGVVDFLNMSCCGITNPYIFNVADIFIFAGAIGLVLFTGDKQRKKAP